ncbi:MAG: hypothetical protein Q8O67_29330 [Deltaproteobacteria bacterium]|nr:hypothetical protein [Deltaproteobacteria bacterium]
MADDFWDAYRGDRTVDPFLDAAIAAGIAASQRSAARVSNVVDLLSETGTELRIEGLHGFHYVRRNTFGVDYCARVDVPGVLPRLLITKRFPGPSADDIATYGRVVQFDNAHLAQRHVARTNATDVLRPFDTEVVAVALGDRNVRIALRRDTDRRTVVEVDAFVGGGRDATPGLHIITIIARIAQSLAESGAVFSEKANDNRPPAERVEALVTRVSDAVSWVTGPVARVGDGVEARLALEEQPDAPSVLRFDLDGKGKCTVFFEGRLIERNEKTTTLRPQEGFLDRLRGLLDAKIDDPVFDDAWLIEGDPAVGKQLAAHASILLRLRERHAAIEVGPAGLIVRVAAFDDEDGAVVDVVGSILGLWRNLCRQARGFDSALAHD